MANESRFNTFTEKMQHDPKKAEMLDNLEEEYTKMHNMHDRLVQEKTICEADIEGLNDTRTILLGDVAKNEDALREVTMKIYRLQSELGQIELDIEKTTARLEELEQLKTTVNQNPTVGDA